MYSVVKKRNKKNMQTNKIKTVAFFGERQSSNHNIGISIPGDLMLWIITRNIIRSLGLTLFGVTLKIRGLTEDFEKIIKLKILTNKCKGANEKSMVHSSNYLRKSNNSTLIN